jgi:hypothetical protein
MELPQISHIIEAPLAQGRGAEPVFDGDSQQRQHARINHSNPAAGGEQAHLPRSAKADQPCM